MAHFSNQIGPAGPLLGVYVTVSLPRAQALQALNLLVPQPVAANLLIDTGAAISAIDWQIVNALGLQPTGVIVVQTPTSGPQGAILFTYDIGLVAFGVGGQNYALGILPVVATNFAGQGIGGLLGRDMLAATRLTYAGPENIFLMST